MFATRYDLHTHSTYSDGNDDVGDIIHRANSLHLDTIAITDHFWPSMGSQRGGKNIIERRRYEIETARSDYPSLAILDGAEVDIQSNGTLAPVAGGLEQFDIIIGSFHHVSDSRAWAISLTKALKKPQFQILGHWDGYLSSYRDEDGRTVAKAMTGTGIAIELNGRYMSEHTEFLELARDTGCIFSLGSDSHSVETIGQLDYQRKLASDLELELVEPSDLTALKSA
ncbi:MAG: PHP domain-containing protein [Candidatus Thorarchaeota archaeon]